MLKFGFSSQSSSVGLDAGEYADFGDDEGELEASEVTSLDEDEAAVALEVAESDTCSLAALSFAFSDSDPGLFFSPLLFSSARR